MIVGRLRLVNYKCFRGEHVLDLGPGVFAVTARDADNPDRSNWLGKSTLANSILHALSGDHGEQREDDWISRGEDEGELELRLIGDALDDATPVAGIKRTRRRGKSTQLVTSNGAKQGDAQKWIWRLLGLSEEDLLNTGFARQKELSALLHADPADRMRVVSSWIDLAPVQRCEARARDELAEATQCESKLATEERMLAAQLEAIGARALRLEELAEIEAQVGAMRAEAAALRERAVERGRWEADARDAAEFDELDATGRTLRAEVDRDDEAALEAAADRAVELSEAMALEARAAGEKRAKSLELARGQFDGGCPVMGRPCPAADTVRDATRGDKAAVARAKAVANNADSRAARAAAARRDAEGALGAARRRRERLEALRERATALLSAAERHGEQSPLAAEPAAGLLARADSLAREAAEQSSRLAVAADSATMLENVGAEFALVRQQRAEAQRRARTARELVVVFGRGGAQRRIAEDDLAEIQDGANELLGRLGSGLSVSASWGRENASEPASHCDACGLAFPLSKTAKLCQGCGAARGPKVVERLDLSPSSRSGGADDLCGLALKVSAAAWLRGMRGSPWSTLVLDEPFGALDAHHRRALSVALASMLGGAARQVIVVAHERGLMQAMPRQIQITSSGGWSRAEVE